MVVTDVCVVDQMVFCIASIVQVQGAVAIATAVEVFHVVRDGHGTGNNQSLLTQGTIIRWLYGSAEHHVQCHNGGC